MIDDALIVSMLAATIRISAPLLFAALGELVTERAGVWNLGVEGTVLMGGFVAFFVSYWADSLWFGVVGAMLAGMLMGVIMAFMSATLKVNQFLSGLALNLLAAGLTLFWYRIELREFKSDIPSVDRFVNVAVPFLSEIPLVGRVFFTQTMLTYWAFAMVLVVWFFLYRTKYGLEIRCIGENPKAIDMKGLSVTLRQYLALMFGGAMSGLAGAHLVLVLSGLVSPGMSGGRGWLALVIIIAANWLPGRILIAVLVFAFLEAFQLHAQALGFSQVPHQVFLSLPYVAAIAVMMILRGRSNQPQHLGVAYHRE